MDELAGHVIVCGVAGIGMRIVDQLVASGEQVVVVGRTPDPRLTAAAARWGVPHLVAGVGIAEALAAAGLSTAMAVICVEQNELWNLETAVLARELRPDVNVVAQLSNATVGGAMNDDGGPGGVLDIADLAAPSVVEACLGITVHDVEIAETGFVAARLDVAEKSTLRALYGDLAPVAVVGPGGELVACPGRDHTVGPGDVATMLGTDDDFARAGITLTRGSEAGEQSFAPRRRHRIRAAFRGFVEDTNPNFFRMLAVLLTLLVISSTVLRIGYTKPGMSILDALYFSTETIATVGYGDFTFSDQAVWLRLFSIVLMFAGVTTTALLMAFLAELLISRRLSHTAGKRAARFMSGHVVVIGLGAFGIRVARELKSLGRDVVVIERSEDSRFVSAAAALDVPVIFGDATLTETLVDARVAQASAVAVLTSDDMVNIETGIAVRGVLGDRWADRPGRPGVPVVMRVFDRSLGDAVADRFGFRYVRSTEELAAPWFIGAALGLEVLGTFSVGPRSFMVGRLEVTVDGGLDGMAMHELSAHTRVIAIGRVASGVVEHPPRRGTSFAAGDHAYVVGPYEELLGVLRRDRGLD
jgi:Trk K+ transport system NAD-binding subunit